MHMLLGRNILSPVGLEFQQLQSPIQILHKVSGLLFLKTLILLSLIEGGLSLHPALLAPPHVPLHSSSAIAASPCLTVPSVKDQIILYARALVVVRSGRVMVPRSGCRIALATASGLGRAHLLQHGYFYMVTIYQYCLTFPSLYF